MANINKVILIGRVGKDPETSFNANGTTQVTKFSLATSEFYTDKSNEKKEITEWHNIVLWNKLSDIYKEVIKKGTLLFIEGKIKTNKWTNAENVTMYRTEIWANTIQVLSKIERSQQSSNSGFPKDDGIPSFDEFTSNDDDIPF
ncbi:single-stranded DNA-binding protein [bacterium]|nr:single-stranded DNA-binding protein [bacterium]